MKKYAVALGVALSIGVAVPQAIASERPHDTTPPTVTCPSGAAPGSPYCSSSCPAGFTLVGKDCVSSFSVTITLPANPPGATGGTPDARRVVDAVVAAIDDATLTDLVTGGSASIAVTVSAPGVYTVTVTVNGVVVATGTVTIKGSAADLAHAAKGPKTFLHLKTTKKGKAYLKAHPNLSGAKIVVTTTVKTSGKHPTKKTSSAKVTAKKG